MEGTGCVVVLVVLVVILAAIIAATVASAVNSKRREAARVERGQQIAELFDHLVAKPDDERVEQSLFDMLSGKPVGYDPQLTAVGGWFDRARPVLNRFSHVPERHALISWFFTCFTFPSGQQSAVLSWLHSVFLAGIKDPAAFATFEAVAHRLMTNSAQTEAMWLYQRMLDAVTTTTGDTRVKSAALSIGRIAHAKGRPDGHPTIYDEQAIANDIASRIPQVSTNS